MRGKRLVGEDTDNIVIVDFKIDEPGIDPLRLVDACAGGVGSSC